MPTAWDPPSAPDCRRSLPAQKNQVLKMLFGPRLQKLSASKTSLTVLTRQVYKVQAAIEGPAIIRLEGLVHKASEN